MLLYTSIAAKAKIAAKCIGRTIRRKEERKMRDNIERVELALRALRWGRKGDLSRYPEDPDLFRLTQQIETNLGKRNGEVTLGEIRDELAKIYPAS
jgi:hypothetical protein